MHVFISTHNEHKEKELSRYFKNIGINTTHIPYQDYTTLNNLKENYICVYEQTSLISKKTNEISLLNHVEEVIHTSIITLEIINNNKKEIREYKATVDGFIFPNLKTDRMDVYNWDDIFVSSRTMKSYQEMKDKGIKNSARDIAFSKMIEDLPDIFKFEQKINLNFNPTIADEVISFDPFIKKLFDENDFYKLVYSNPLFYSLINNILNEGLFIRRASDRQQKNYGLPGLNAGIPLTLRYGEISISKKPVEA